MKSTEITIGTFDKPNYLELTFRDSQEVLANINSKVYDLKSLNISIRFLINPYETDVCCLGIDLRKSEFTCYSITDIIEYLLNDITFAEFEKRNMRGYPSTHNLTAIGEFVGRTYGSIYNINLKPNSEVAYPPTALADAFLKKLSERLEQDSRILELQLPKMWNQLREQAYKTIIQRLAEKIKCQQQQINTLIADKLSTEKRGHNFFKKY